MMKFADTHSHIYAADFQDDLPMVMERSLNEGVDAIFLPAIDAEHHEKMLNVVSEYPANCYPMMGLHPTSVKENYRDELEIVERNLADSAIRFYGIGEIGIDLYWDKTHAAEQQDAFNFQLDLAIRYDFPVIIHTRNSMDLALDILEKRRDSRIRGIFHCFGGNIRQAERAIGLGFLLGIGGVITYKNSGLQQVVEHVAIEHLVLETDAPWLTPVPHRGKRNEPSFIPLIAAKIAEIKKTALPEIAEITYKNALKLLINQ